MSITSHRIKKIVYAERAISFRSGDNLGDAILSHPTTNDFRNDDGGGVIEIPLSSLKEIFELFEEYDLTKEDAEMLKAEIEQISLEGDKTDDDYILYDLF